MRIYISIPITGEDEKVQRNKAERLKTALSLLGYEVVNPFDIIPEKENPDWFDHMGADLREISKCDRVYFCDGWQNSKGCKLEMQYVVSMGIEPIFEKTNPVEIYYR